MRLGKVLKGLVIVLCAVLVCAPAAAVDPVTCLFDFDEDGDIDGRDLVYFAAGFDGNDLDLFAEFFGNGGCQPLSSAPPDVDWGITADEQQGGGGLVGQTVRILNGNSFVLRRDVFFASAHSHGLIFTASYNSRATTSNALGAGWSHTYSVFLNPAFTFDGQSYLKIVDGTGRGVYFTQDTGVFRGAFHERTHVSLDAGTYVWHRLDGSRYGFSQAGVLLWIEDEKGNRLELGYDALDRLASVVDVASGRALSLHYNEDNHIESIAGPLTAAVPDGIWVSLDYDAGRNLSSVTYADGSGFFYSYTDPRDGHNLTEMRNRAGHLINTWAYDDQDRCVENFSFRGNGVAVAYVSGYTVDVTDAYGVQRSYSLRSIGGRKRVSAIQGPASPPYTNSNVTRWVYDERMNLIEVELSGGTVHRYENFDERGNPQTGILASGTPQERVL